MGQHSTRTGSFKGHETQHLRFFADLVDREDAEDVLRQHARAGDWLKFIVEWLDAFDSLPNLKAGEKGVKLIQSLMALLEKEDRESPLLVPLNRVAASCRGEAELQALFDAYLAKALSTFGAGQAGVVRSIIEVYLDGLNEGHKRGLADPAAVVDWLFDHGSAELRSRFNTAFLAGFCLYITGFCSDSATWRSKLQQACESLTEKPSFGRALLEAVPSGSRIWQMLKELFAAPDDLTTALEALNGAVVAGLPIEMAYGKAEFSELWSQVARGMLTGGFRPTAFATMASLVFKLKPPETDGARDLTVVLRLLEEFENAPINEIAASTNLQQWSDCLLSLVLDMAGVMSPSLADADISRIFRIAGRMPDQRTTVNKLYIARILKLVEESTPKGVLRLVTASMIAGEISFTENSALELSKMVADHRKELARERPEVAYSGFREDLQKYLGRILQYQWKFPVFGVDVAELLRGGQKVLLCNLESDNVVGFDDPSHTIKFADRYARDLQTSAGRSADERLALCSLYFVHELLHHRQNVNKKESVELLRRASAEELLMHLDLTADHFACLVCSLVFPALTLPYLKNLQANSLHGFPVRASHTRTARFRKARRLAAIRMESNLLKSDRDDFKVTSATGYGYLEFDRLSHYVAFAQTGPPLMILGVTSLALDDIKVLDSCADAENGNADGLARLDKVLNQVAVQIWPGL